MEAVSRNNGVTASPTVLGIAVSGRVYAQHVAPPWCGRGRPHTAPARASRRNRWAKTPVS